MVDGKKENRNPEGGASPAAAGDRFKAPLKRSRGRRASVLRAGPRSGFTAIELMVVVAFIAIIAMMAVPSLAMLAPQYMVRSSARGLDSLMQKARITAGNTQKPTRVVIDCRPASQTDDNAVCNMRLYTANFNDLGELDITGARGPWSEVHQSRRNVPDRVAVSSPSTNVADGNPENVYWAVFMPTGKAKTSHDPMRLHFKVAKGPGGSLELGLSQYTGRATVRVLR